MPYLKPSAKINSEWQMSSIWHSLDMDVIFLPFWSIIHLFYMKTYIKVSIYDLFDDALKYDLDPVLGLQKAN